MAWSPRRASCIEDAVEPELVGQAEQVLRGVAGIEDVGRVRMRWIGDALHAEADIEVAADLAVSEGTASPTTVSDPAARDPSPRFGHRASPPDDARAASGTLSVRGQGVPRGAVPVAS
jgi:hypothetical protein